MAKISSEFPKVPSESTELNLVYSVGRLAMAWSASEHYLALLLVRLMAQADLESDEGIKGALAGSAIMQADTNSIFSIFLAIESSRGRREVVRNIADTRASEGWISKEWHDKIMGLLSEHGKIGKLRNRFLHTPIVVRDDGSYGLLDERMMIARNDLAPKQKNRSVRLNNTKVSPNQVDDVSSRLEGWIADALDLTRSLESRPRIGQAPQ